MPRFRYVWLAFLAFCLLPTALAAQVRPSRTAPDITFGVGADLANRHVWRGLDRDNGPNLQPIAWVRWNLLELGTWGSHSLDGDYHEQDFWLRYHFPAGPNAGALSIAVNDYYRNPDFGEDFFDFRGVGACQPGEIGFGRPARCARGAHTVEVEGVYRSRANPYDLLFAYNFHNDPEDSIYLEGALRPVYAGFELRLVAGGVLGRSENYYFTDGAAFINLGAGIGRALTIGPIRIPVTAQVIHNPEVGETWYVVRGGVWAGS